MTLAKTAHYYVPQPSSWPIVGSIALFLMATGATTWFNGAPFGKWIVLAGFLVLVYMMFGWFGKVIHESEGGSYNAQVDVSFRWGMGWFIFSEVMFFAAFFGALFYARVLSVPWLGDLEQKLLWPDFSAQWPTAGPAAADPFTPMGAWGIPAFNTLLLLSSGVTVTWAHWALKANNRGQLIFGLILTIALGVTFLCFQAYEYIHAYSELNLKLSSGIYGSTFFMLTGFHGFHVTVGAIMLTVILFRCIAGHFKPDHHFAFEGVSWYWHFVDVVWLLLFVLVYWL
jgi:cytochrome c oxidase subunit III